MERMIDFVRGLNMNSGILRIKKPGKKNTWIMTQTWEHLLFAHWPISSNIIRRLIPDGLEIDTFDGQAWISVIPFLMSGIRLRFLPIIPYTSTFPEINVRTYVKANNKPGVFFITLDAANSLALHIAKIWYHLPYYKAKMSFQDKGQNIEFWSRRLDSSHSEIKFHGNYRPISPPFAAQKGTIEHWLTERYIFYCRSSYNNKIYYGEVYHEPWELQTAEAEISSNTMTQALHPTLPQIPALLQYSRGVQALIWPLHQCNL
jgi:uncharacterized protein YqjF (DUF2071 family)